MNMRRVTWFETTGPDEAQHGLKCVNGLLMWVAYQQESPAIDSAWKLLICREDNGKLIEKQHHEVTFEVL